MIYQHKGADEKGAEKQAGDKCVSFVFRKQGTDPLQSHIRVIPAKAHCCPE